MWRSLAPVLMALLLSNPVARPAGAAWGQKSRNCPRLVSTLETLEQAGTDPADPHLRRLRNRVADKCVAMNEIQVLGTHNSYHIEPKPPLMSLLLSADPAFAGLQYSHPALDVQFGMEGARQIEIDVFADPDGGLYYYRRILVILNQDIESHIPELLEPGFKVLHAQDVDFRTQCLTFVDCLHQIKDWSDANPRHLPLMVLVEAKDDTIPDPLDLGFVIPIPIGTPELDALDAEIRSVIPARQLITPDRVRRGRPTLEDAILTIGWPRLDAVRGKIMFLLDNEGKRAAYLNGHPSLEGRVIFTNSTPGDPDAAFVKMNDPFATSPSIAEVVAAGYVVRTRSDADTVEARSGDTGPRDAALASGAQAVSTDYPEPDPRFGTGYMVAIPGGMPARCNPVNAPAGCRNEALERLN